jgi:hypothetical protein
MYDVYLKTLNVDVKCRIKISGIHFQDQKYCNENSRTITELMNNSIEYTIYAKYEITESLIMKTQGGI